MGFLNGQCNDVQVPHALSEHVCSKLEVFSKPHRNLCSAMLQLNSNLVLSNCFHWTKTCNLYVVRVFLLHTRNFPRNLNTLRRCVLRKFHYLHCTWFYFYFVLCVNGAVALVFCAESQKRKSQLMNVHVHSKVMKPKTFALTRKPSWSLIPESDPCWCLEPTAKKKLLLLELRVRKRRRCVLVPWIRDSQQYRVSSSQIWNRKPGWSQTKRWKQWDRYMYSGLWSCAEASRDCAMGNWVHSSTLPICTLEEMNLGCTLVRICTDSYLSRGRGELLTLGVVLSMIIWASASVTTSWKMATHGSTCRISSLCHV